MHHPPGAIVAIYTGLPELMEHLPNIYELIHRVRKDQFPRPVNLTSSAERSTYSSTGLLTKKEIDKLTYMDEELREQL